MTYFQNRIVEQMSDDTDGDDNDNNDDNDDVTMTITVY